jgi:DNA-binding NarL/FixJ family response regulator
MSRKLTDRQLEFVVCLANGYRVEDIANEKHVSKTTVERVIAAARRRAEARTNAHLVSLIIASGALEWNPDDEKRTLNGVVAT